MKRLHKIAIRFVLLLFSLLIGQYTQAQLHSYASSSILKEGKFVKIRIKESGVYKLTYEDLKSMGIEPALVKIFGYGGALLPQSFMQAKHDDLPEIPIYMHTGSDGVFNAGDYILFYAQGVNSWKYDKSRQMYVHALNHYSEYGYYFVSSDYGDGRRIQAEDYDLPDGADYVEADEFVDFKVYEKELRNLARSGKVFYGEMFDDGYQLNINFDFPNTVKNEPILYARLDVAANSSSASTFTLNLNSSDTRIINVAQKSNDHYEKAKDSNSTFIYSPTNDNQNFTLTYNSPASAAKGYLNYLEVNIRRKLKMSGSVMRFQNPINFGLDNYTRFSLSDATNDVEIWDISNHVNVKKVSAVAYNGNRVFFSHNQTEKSYLAINPKDVGAFAKPEIVGTVPNQNLHGMLHADMVIITHPNFLQQANRLANEHNQRGEITVNVVTTEQVYNEFSSGTPDATAYRWVMKMLYDRANLSGEIAKRPKYLLLFGRGSYDNRKILDSSGYPFILTYQADNSLIETNSYVTDDYFAFLEDTEGENVPSHSMDIAVGRFPVTTEQGAVDVVSKTLNYMKNEQRGIWKNQVCFLADDGDNALHAKQAEQVANVLASKNSSFQITKIYLDAYQQIVNASGESYPVAHTQFHNMLRNGMFVMDFTGHASPMGWTNEQILTAADVRSLSNKNLPLWVAVTCNFLQFDLPAISAGEEVLLNPVGGGIGIISATRPVYASQNLSINREMINNLFTKEAGKYPSIGEVLRKAKNRLGNEVNKLSYVLMGDPSLKLNYPDQYRVLTKTINETPAIGRDTLQALSVVKIGGIIADEYHNKVPDFNGVLSAVVYDKIQTISTLNNDREENGVMTYTDRLNKLFSGSVKVENGEFEIVFMLPKDIKYNYGTGRINYYATCDDTGSEAQGFYESFFVGGSNPNVVYEEEGPEIDMYLNNPTFKTGDKVNEAPVFIAHVQDESGINQVGSGIGHDITLVLDEDPEKTYNLNDFYQSVANDYTQGTVRYKLPTLSEGKHILTFKVWDLMNNSSEKTVEFEVVKGLEPQIFSVSNYPNPVKSYTRFVVNHDRPESVLDTQVDIFDLAGRKVWSFKQATLGDIEWNVQDSRGRLLPTGVYLYRVAITLDNKTVHSKMNKLIITE